MEKRKPGRPRMPESERRIMVAARLRPHAFMTLKQLSLHFCRSYPDILECALDTLSSGIEKNLNLTLDILP